MNYYRFCIQPPYFYPKYTPRTLTTEMVKKRSGVCQIDLSPLTKMDGKPYIPGGDDGYHPAYSAFWVSLVLNSYRTKVHRSKELPSFIDTWETEISFMDGCPVGPCFLDMVDELNKQYDSLTFSLLKCTSWKSVLSALAEGYTVMVGGSVYYSFQQAQYGGIVPMPNKNEGLLGGHIFNLVSYDTEKDLATAIGNLGEDFGNGGIIPIRGAYLRNLNINRDFFILLVEKNGNSRSSI